MGRLGSFSPTRPRRMARATAFTASSWPTIRFFSSASSPSSFSPSSWLMRWTGMPVHSAATAATSSSVTEISSSVRPSDQRFRALWSWETKSSSTSRSRAAAS